MFFSSLKEGVLLYSQRDSESISYTFPHETKILKKSTVQKVRKKSDNYETRFTKNIMICRLGLFVYV